jgi:hypothetical protein
MSITITLGDDLATKLAHQAAGQNVSLEDFALGILENAVKTDAAEKAFRRLAKRWQRDCKFDSSASAMTQHEAYRSIVAMGMPVVPAILRELQKRPNHWFEALHEITGEDPIPRGAWGDMAAMTAAWIEWGKKRGLL